jgi:hypothetical protein
MNACCTNSDVFGTKVVLTTEDGEPLLQESGAALVVAYCREDAQVFVKEFCNCEEGM